MANKVPWLSELAMYHTHVQQSEGKNKNDEQNKS